ncbi:MAG: hypothetical protein FJ308_18640 [Planctomycetes bacterium]|nr:hypothetical protein [Planctomycetota bacterium]
MKLIPMLPVRSVVASLSFYQQLGFTVEQFREEWGWAMLRIGEARLMLDQSICHPHPLPRQGIIYLYPDDIAQYHQSVKARGLDIPDLETTFYGMIEFRIDDPDGNRFWIGQPTDRTADEAKA